MHISSSVYKPKQAKQLLTHMWLDFNVRDNRRWISVMFFNQLFRVSFWRHPFTAEDPFASDVMIYFSKSVLLKNTTFLQTVLSELRYFFISMPEF